MARKGKLTDKQRIGTRAMRLKKHKGKKLYGYLNKDTKNIVDDIVKELI